MVGCEGRKQSKPKEDQKELHYVTFPSFNSQYKNKKLLNVSDKSSELNSLDSVQFINWTDKYVPYKTNTGRLYSADIYSVQPQISNYAILVIRTNADDWFKLHMISINGKLEMIDKVEVSTSSSDLLEQAGDTEIVGSQLMYTNKVSDNEYRRINIKTIESINYYTDSTTYETDSIITKILIRNDGTFKLTRKDSVRITRYSNIDL